MGRMPFVQRATIDLDDRLLVLAKQRAAAEGRTLKSLVEEALRVRVSPRAPAEAEGPLPVDRPTRPGARPGVDVRDNERLADLLDE